MTLYVLTVWLHVLAAATWIGSMVFFAAVVVPLLRRPDLRATAPVLLRTIGPRFRVLGWAALAVLVVTGVANLPLRGYGFEVLREPGFWSAGFGRLLAWKLALVAVVLGATALHGAAATAPASNPEAAERARRRASRLGRFVMLVSLAIALLAVAMVRGWG